jgi:hypothetical protein
MANQPKWDCEPKEYIWGRPSIGREHHGIHGSDVQPVAVLACCCYVGTKIENLVGFDIVWLHSKMHFLSNYIITCNLTAKARGRDYDLSEYAIFGCWFPICHMIYIYCIHMISYDVNSFPLSYLLRRMSPIVFFCEGGPPSRWLKDHSALAASRSGIILTSRQPLHVWPRGQKSKWLIYII